MRYVGVVDVTTEVDRGGLTVTAVPEDMLPTEVTIVRLKPTKTKL